MTSKASSRHEHSHDQVLDEYLLPPLRYDAITPAALQGIQKYKIGKVVSDKSAKTIVVEVISQAQHRKFKKRIGKMKKFYAHDENQIAKVGDVVLIISCRPLSKLKRWRLVKVIKQGPRFFTTD